MIKKLFGNNIAVKVSTDEGKTASGIVLPGQKGNDKQFGEVVAVGEGLMLNNGERAKMSVDVGAKVLFRQYAGMKIKQGDEELLILGMNDVIAEIA